MGYAFRIGEPIVWGPEYYHLDQGLVAEEGTPIILRITREDAPYRSNTTSWSGAGLREFIDRNALQDLFYHPTAGLIRDSQIMIHLIYWHLNHVQTARINIQKALAQPSVNSTQLQSDDLFLTWMEWWIEYALSVYKAPFWHTF